ncbi:ChaN family lipoprotein [Catenovulum sp. SM1970]|uniref:ChaN family lipoprotein n=1 Tax=Marinifaba aquimaris TaxID=2741323 RepID=UPI00157217EB|nr:ChaN family lipoprotein [Marinifaba aquimaris]NTS76223.1 ChaN family lipoprotein [Marinifaba aquimaris]
MLLKIIENAPLYSARVLPWLSVIGLLFSLSACSVKPVETEKAQVASSVNLLTAYDYQLLDNQYQTVSLPAVASQLKDADVIFIGEYHGNHASHLLQMQLFALLHQQREHWQPMALSLEMFERDQQAVIERYLSSEIGERYLIEQANAWDNYKASYRPLVEYAKQHDIAVVAANAPADIVRCIGKQGRAYLNVLGSQQRKLIAQDSFADITGYQTQFIAKMGGHPMPARALNNTYLAQLTRDNTMAESINQKMALQPDSQIIHLNGSFHSQDGLGTVAALKRLNPALKLVVITPVYRTDLMEKVNNGQGKDTFYYLIQAQPQEFVDADYRKATYQKMFAKAGEKAKSCENPN